MGVRDMVDASNQSERILDHIGRYRISLREVISRRYLDGADSGNVIKKLVKDGTIVARDRASGNHLPGGLTYYQLTAQGARKAQFPISRTKPMGGMIPQYLAYLWFCCMGSNKRELMSPELLRRCIQNTPDAKSGHYAVQKTENGTMFYRLFYLGKSKDTYALKNVTEAFAGAMDHPELSILLKQKLFRPTILVNQEGRKKALRTLFKQKLTGPQIQAVKIEVVPSIENLNRALHEFRNKT